MASPESFKTYTEVSERLSKIVEQVRSKDTSLEQSLDLFDEAIELSARAVDLVDKSEFSPEEEAKLAETGEDSTQSPEAQDSEAEDGGDKTPGKQG